MFPSQAYSVMSIIQNYVTIPCSIQDIFLRLIIIITENYFIVPFGDLNVIIILRTVLITVSNDSHNNPTCGYE